MNRWIRKIVSMAMVIGGCSIISNEADYSVFSILGLGVMLAVAGTAIWAGWD